MKNYPNFQLGSRINRPVDYNFTSSAGVFVLPHEQDRIRDNIIENSKLYTNHFIDQTDHLDHPDQPDPDRISADPESIRNLRRANTRAKIINEDIYSQAYISYINIDSSSRNKYPTNIYESKICNLPPHPIEFTNGSSKIKIYLPDHNFKSGQHISLSNVVSKNLILNGILSVKKNSSYLRINHRAHGLSLYGLYSEHDITEFEPVHYVDEFGSGHVQILAKDLIPDSKQFYIWKNNCSTNLTIQLDGIVGDMIGNIPVNYLNGKHTVYILFTKDQTRFVPVRNAYVIKLSRRSNINYRDNNNSIYVKYNNLFGIPLCYLNSGSNESMTILSTGPDMLIVDVCYKAIVDPDEPFYDSTDNIGSDQPDIQSFNRGGGTQAYIRLIREITKGYPNPNNYLVILDKVYRNVISARIISSTFPNSHTMINCSNNKLYWKNLDDGNHTYSLMLDFGNYTPSQLKNKLEQAFANTIRHPYCSDHQRFDSNGLLKYHLVEIDIDPETNIVIFSTYKQLLRRNSANNPIMTLIYDKVQFVLNMTINIIPGDIIFICSTIGLYVCDTHTDQLNLQSRIESDRSVLINFYNSNNQNSSDVQHIVKSIGTETVLEKFIFNDIFNTVHLTNHQLKIGDLIITDQFLPSELLIFEIISITSEDIIKVKKCDIGFGYKFIYNNILINFGPGPITQDNLIMDIIPDLSGKINQHIYHPNHCLDIGTNIKINSDKYTVSKIIDDDYYEVCTDKLILAIPDTICITYPDIFQLCFNFPDTIGPILGFDKINETPYRHIIRNIDLCSHQSICRLVESDYFYITCPELNTGIEYYRNTAPVPDVFAQVRWLYNDYGGISFDSFVPTTKVFNLPIDILTELNISIVRPDGQLVDLNGFNHSFTIEITEVFNQPAGTDISARINSEIISRRV